MSKISQETLHDCVSGVLQGSKDKPRKFLETIELQVGLKGYDLKRDKRFSGAVRLPYVPRPNMRVCVLADQIHKDQADRLGLPVRTVDDLKKLNRDKKLTKQLEQAFDVFLASESVIKQVPRLLGPVLNKAGKFPSLVTATDNLQAKVDDVRAAVKFQLKKSVSLAVAIGNVGMSEEQVTQNLRLSVNLLVSLLKKNWQNVRSLYIKSTMGTPYRLF